MESAKLKRFYTGDYRHDADNARALSPRVDTGWIVGHFMPEGPRKTDSVEVKYWHYKAGVTGHGAKVSKVFECTMILTGHVIGFIDEQIVELSAGHYFVVPPDVPNNIPMIATDDCAGITIKAPSVKGSKEAAT